MSIPSGPTGYVNINNKNVSISSMLGGQAPNLQDMVLRTLLNVSHLLKDQDGQFSQYPVNLQKVSILRSTGTAYERERVSIVIPCYGMDPQARGAIDAMMLQMGYEYYTELDCSAHGEYRLDYFQQKS